MNIELLNKISMNQILPYIKIKMHHKQINLFHKCKIGQIFKKSVFFIISRDCKEKINMMISIKAKKKHNWQNSSSFHDKTYQQSRNRRELAVST